MEAFEFHNYKNEISFLNKIGRLLWNFYAAFFFRTMPTRYLNWVRVLGLRMFGAKLGRKGVSIHRTVRVWAPWNLVMEDYTLIDRNCRVYNPGVITLKRESVISENVFLCTASHNVHSRRHELITKPILLKGKNWVAADSILLPGVTLGEGSVVGAGAVVAVSVPDWKIVAGNPAEIISNRDFRD